MSKVITFSRVFPAYHPKAGQPTYFVEKLILSFKRNLTQEQIIGCKKMVPLNLLKILSNNLSDLGEPDYWEKHHTIRSGNRFKVGDKFSPRVWSGKPYRSKQIIIAPDIEVKKVWDVIIETNIDEFNQFNVTINREDYTNIQTIAHNDGLEMVDFMDWFNKSVFKGQIICWNENVEY